MSADSIIIIFVPSVLEINFLESDYSILEGNTNLSSPIMIQLRQNQNPFTLKLSPVTIDTAASITNLSFFIDFQNILPTFRATAGIVNVPHNNSLIEHRMAGSWGFVIDLALWPICYIT